MFDWLKAKKPVSPPQAMPGAPQRQEGQPDSQAIELGEGLRIHLKPFEFRMQSSVLSCWMYRSEGLLRLGQRELLYAVVRGAGQPLKDPLYHTQVVAKLAAGGQLVTVGGYSVFGPSHPGMFGRKDFRGVGYAYPYNLERALPAGSDMGDYLAVIGLTETEVASTQRFGLARTLARLGQVLRFFPYPVWNDVNRPEAMDGAFLERTILRGFGDVVSIGGMAPLRERGVVRVRLGALDARQLAEALTGARAKSVGLLAPTKAGWDRCAACLTWVPGSREPMAISALVTSDEHSKFEGQGESLLGCFLGFAIMAGQGEGIKMFEDGYCLIVTDARASELIAALQDHQRFALVPTEGMLPFEFIPA